MNLIPFHRKLLSLALFLALIGGKTALAAEDSEVCGAEVSRQERQQAIPDRLLHAISLVESGRWDSEHRATLAWPWTVMAEGEGRFLPSKQAAIAEVEKLHARGVRNIDVGCMQVNLLAHPDAFASLDEAFEPRSNVAYAGHFLKDLFGQDGDWAQAAGHYHSQTPEIAAPYRSHLLSVWNDAKGKGDRFVQLAALETDTRFRLPLGLSYIQEPAPKAEPAKGAAADPLGRTEAERAAAKKSADAYRQAKLDEYRQRHPILAKG